MSAVLLDFWWLWTTEGLLCGIFEYAGIDARMTWNKTAGNGKPAEIFAELVENSLVLAPAIISGNRAKTGSFHVHFQTGT